MSSLTTDLNVSPYFDDYDEDKRYSRILFRPAVAVQARELTQSQTILQNQIQRFGDHNFKDGSIVDGVARTYYPNVHFISLDDTFNTVNTRFVSSLANNNYLVTNMDASQSSNAVRAVIKLAIDGNKAAAPYTNRLYLDYIATGTNTSSNADINEFQPGDTLYIYNASQSKLGTLDSNNLIDTISTLASNGSFTSNGYSYCVSVSDGIIYQKGFFSKVPAQTLAIGNTLTTNVAGYVIGFDTVETIVTENQDTTLNDNALGYDNENAPGAHRLQLTPTLVSKLANNTSNNTNFFAITIFDGQEPTQEKGNDQYAALEDALAERTYQESGDYVVRPFNIDTTSSSNSQTFYYNLSSGTAFVRGYQVDRLNSTNIETDRATTTEYALNRIITANYGNYVICNEYLGTFDHELLQSVDLYDTAQQSITQIEGISSSLSGSSIGKANVRAIAYKEGSIGSSEAQYYVYLFNIQMNSGKSFSDVKSIVETSGTFGNARADIVLENDKAVLKNASSSSLVWDTGIPAVKRLTDNTGITSTSFVYTQIASGTFANNGNVTITIETAAPGATSESLIDSVGTYSTAAALADYNVFLTANAYTANLSGTIAVTTGNATIVGTSTKFSNDFSIGDLLKFQEGANAYYAKVATITSNTVMSITNIANTTSLVATGLPPAAAANAAAKYQKFFITGSPVKLSSITVISNTQFTATTGYNFDSADQTSYVSFPVLRNGAKAIAKIINKDVFVKIDCSNNVANSVGPWDLGLVDVNKIANVYVGTTYSETNTDRSDWFTLDNGQRDDIYDHAQLYVKPEYASNINASSKFLVKLNHFTANVGGGVTAGVGFFSAESYPVDDANTANTNGILTVEIPTYNNIDLRSAIDVRVRKYNTANASANGTTATINPTVSNTSFDVYSGGQHVITPDQNFTASYEYYLPRYDLITINSNGDATVQKGIPSTNPRTPFVENDQSAIAEVYVPPYPSVTQKEAETYNRKDISMQVKLVGNRRYTMKDIGTLDERIKRLEYYTVLNTLEQQAKDLTIPDANGLNRFKNGIFADPFNSHNIGNVEDLEYKIAIDERETVARPFFTTTPIDYTFSNSSSSNVSQIGSYVTLNYGNEKFITQEYATKYRVCCESIWQWNGILSLYPSQDMFADETENVNELDITLRNRNNLNRFNSFAGVYGRWATKKIRRALKQQSSSNSTNTSQSQRDTVSNIRPNTVTERIEVGSYITDISIQPYVRSRKVAFIAYNMKPNTTLHAFFDNVNVDAHCAPGVIANTSATVVQGREDLIVNKNGNYGDPLVSNSSGGVAGVFLIPAQTFRTGDRLFQLNTVADLTTGASAQISKSSRIYTASNISVTRNTDTLAVTQPQARPRPTAAPRRNQRDPIAQSFTITGLPDDVTGVVLTQIGVYFQAKDATLGCSIYLCEAGPGGAPKSDKILASGYLTSSQINANTSAPTTETVFNLDKPVFLLNERNYAFIIEPDGNSPEYTVWVGETGGYDINTGAQVFSNPYSGILWISSNQKTWSGIQKEDMMFNLYRAKFTSNTGTVVFNNESDDYFTISGLVRSNNSFGSIAIGDVVYTVNTYANGDFNTANTSAGAPKGIVQYVDEANNQLYLDSSTGNFSNVVSGFNPTIAVFRVSDPTNTALIVANAVVATANIATIDNIAYHAVSPNFGVLQPSKTSLDYEYKGANASSADAAYTTIDNGVEYEFLDYARTLKSVSNESGTKSSIFRINLTSESDYVSPIVNLERKSMLMIKNIINNDVTNEHTRYGNSSTKYVSKQIILADGQDAEDLKVYLTAYRPSNTDIKVYAKFLNSQDPETFDSKDWTLLNYANNTDFVYSSPTDVENYIEYEFSVPTSPNTNTSIKSAFCNVAVNTSVPLAGNVSITNNSSTITGTGTSFTTDFSAGQTIKIAANSTYYAYRDIVSIASATSMTVDLGLPTSNTATLYYVYSTSGNDGILEYNNSAGSRFIGYKYFAIKIVLLSSNPIRVPRLQDVRAIAMQI